MRLYMCVVLLISCSLLAQNPPAQTNPSKPSNTPPDNQGKNEQPAKVKLKREYTDLSGFDLAPKNDTHATQIGGGTRGFGGEITLYAPNKAELFDLHPTVRWTHTAKAQRFIVTFMDSSGAAIYQTEASGRMFRYPDDGPALKPGTTYLWTVQPSSSLMGSRSEPVEIVVVGEPQRSQIRDELSECGQDELSQANVFVKHRIWYDAVEKLSHLIEQSPNPDLYERRAEIYDQVSNTTALAADDRSTALQIPAQH